MVIHHLEDCQYCQGNFGFLCCYNLVNIFIRNWTYLYIYIALTENYSEKRVNEKWKIYYRYLQKLHYETTQ